MKKSISIAGTLVALVSVAFLAVGLVRHAGEIPRFNRSASSYSILFLAVVMFVLEFCMGVFAWVILFRGGKVEVRLRNAYSIMGKAQIAKYLPGNVFHYVNRLVVGTRAGLPTERIAITMGLETILLAATAGIISIIGLLSGWIDFPWLFGTFGTKVQMPLALTLGGIITFAGIILYMRGGKSWLGRHSKYLHPGRIGCVIGIYSAALMLNGIVITILLNAVWHIHSDLPWYRFSCGYTLAWVLGFVVPGAPGGVGVREAVFVGLYGRELGDALAMGLAVVLRAVTSSADLATFIIASWVGRKTATLKQD